MSALNRMSQSLKNPAKIKKLKHKKLDEDWFDTREPIQDGMRFSAKYLGLTLVDEPKGEEVSTAAVQRIINMAKGSKKRLANLVVSSNGIKIYDQISSQLISDVSIHKISYCAALKQHLKVFAFVAQNPNNETMECHAYLCNSIKEAQTLTVTLAQSFKVAYEIGEEQALTNGAENETDAADLRVVNGEKNEKKLTQLAIPNVLEPRYQRFSSESNPFDSSDQEINSPVVVTPETKKIMKREEKKSESDGADPFNDVFTFTSPTSQPPLTPKVEQPITPIRPPPASTRPNDKSSTRRSVTRPTTIENPLSKPAFYQVIQTPSPSKSTPDVEDWDQGFADLAMSRTQEKPSPVENPATTTTMIGYPPSNPFFNPANPFHG